MGQSTPTTTMALDTFVERYKSYRAELQPNEQDWFDELVCRARRHSNAINRRPHLDFERPVLLSMLMEGMRETEALQAELDQTRRQLDEVCRVLAEAGLVMRKVPARSVEELGQAGQTRLDETEGPVSCA